MAFRGAALAECGHNDAGETKSPAAIAAGKSPNYCPPAFHRAIAALRPIGASPSGKAADFDSAIPRFESWPPQPDTVQPYFSMVCDRQRCPKCPTRCPIRCPGWDGPAVTKNATDANLSGPQGCLWETVGGHRRSVQGMQGGSAAAIHLPQAARGSLPAESDFHALTHHFGERHPLLVRRNLQLVEGGRGEGYGRLPRTRAKRGALRDLAGALVAPW